MKIQLIPIILVGKVIRLEPMNMAHVAELTAVAHDPAIWHYLPYKNMLTPEGVSAFVQARLAEQAQGSDLPFTVIEQATGKAIGATRFMEIRPAHRGVEIGGTWYGGVYQRTAVNTECKYLLLRHAFEEWGCIRVQLKTDARNIRSQKAIERIGGVREGMLRKHLILPDGYQRDTIYYSILDAEWPTVKANLEAKMSAYGE